MNGNVIRTITIRGQAEGLDKLTADVNKLAAAQENVAVVSEQSARRVLSLEDAWKKQTLKLDEAARAQANIARETKIADAALREGIATQAQHAQRIDQINQRYTTLTTATKGVAEQTGLARHELINLGRQAQDIGVQLVSGQSPLMILAQQGTQIADVFIASGKSVGSFFTQAIGWGKTFLTSTAGIVTGIAAIGAAAAYAAVQFLKASTTIEQALENENRLLKEGKALIDARTSLEARAQLNPKDLTEYELKRNLLDVQRKLNEEARAALIRTAPRPNIAGDIRGEFAGEAPLTPGMDKVIDATVKLKEAQAAGLPGMKEFNAELGRIATAHPELAKFVDKMIELGRTGIELENAEMRLKAISDAMKGVATNAQLAAVGLGSIAQFKLNNLQAEQAKEATERQAVATLQIAQLYPGMSIEGAKQLNNLSGQLQMAQAVGPMAQIEVQHRLRLVELTDKLGAAEGTRIANYERTVKLAEIETQHQQTMLQLQGQLSVAQESTGAGRINAQYEATVRLLTDQIGPMRAIEQAEEQRAISIAEANTQAVQMLKNLQNEGELIRASDGAEKDRIKARHTYQKLVDDNVDSTLAAAVASKQLANAEEERSKAEIEAADNALKHIRTASDAWAAYRDGIISWSVANDEAGNAARRLETEITGITQAIKDNNEALRENAKFVPFGTTWAGMPSLGMLATAGSQWQSKQGGISQFNPAGYTSNTPYAQALTYTASAFYGPGGYDTTTGAPNAQGIAAIFNRELGKAGGDFSALVGNLLGKEGALTSSPLTQNMPVLDMNMVGLVNRAIELLPKEQQIQAYQREVSLLGQMSTSLETAELIQQLNEKITQLTQATDENTSATSTMTDVLSPFYSNDPRRTHLGFRAFAGGGIMTQYGELPLRHYQGGGMATSPQVAVFGEGSTPEAYVPAPAGRIPVEIKQPANSNQRPVNVNIYVQGSADANTVAALKATAFQQAQAMRRVMG